MTDDKRAWELVLAHIERDLLSGRLRPGDRLPGERVLSVELGVGRSSVREAIRVLEVLGLIRTATGSGPSAGAIIVALPSGGMSALMRLQVAATGFAVADIVATRLVLEAAVVTELADAAADLTTPIELLNTVDEHRLAESEFLALDAQFHLALADASGNQVIAATMAGLRDSIEGYVRAGAAKLTDWDATSARLMDEHRAIIAAISAGDADGASAAVRSHISRYYAETKPAEQLTGDGSADAAPAVGPATHPQPSSTP